jgi:purine-binding chemotaxis protein CheW
MRNCLSVVTNSSYSLAECHQQHCSVCAASNGTYFEQNIFEFHRRLSSSIHGYSSTAMHGVKSFNEDQVDDESALKFLLFSLGGQRYGIDAHKVQEIRPYERVSSIVSTSRFIKGVTELRGVIVPIIDLHLKFNHDRSVYDHHTSIIVLNVAGRLLGLVVDDVLGIIHLTSEEIVPVQHPEQIYEKEYVLGAVRGADPKSILLNIDSLISSLDMGMTNTLDAKWRLTRIALAEQRQE